MPISLTLTPFDHFQIRLTFAVTPNLILEPCHSSFQPFSMTSFIPTSLPEGEVEQQQRVFIQIQNTNENCILPTPRFSFSFVWWG